jgi:competence protein ComEC
MGAAGLVAALADRPRSRWYAVLLAAGATLAVNPRADGDVGWQLSFAAVIGIMLWAKRLAAALSGEADRRSARHALAEAVAVTASATVATAPLMAAAFDQFSPAALPANVLAAPAVAPAMWLGMLTGIAGQAPFLPVEPINWLDSLCLVLMRLVRGPAVALVALVALGLWWPFGSRASHPAAATHLVVRVLDVGQGDSILLDPPNGDPVLVDTGPPGDGVEDRLRELGVDRLSALVITHDQSDHAGELAPLLDSVPVDRLVYGRDDPRLRGAALAAGAEPHRLAEGGQIDSGGLRLGALWPPRELLGEVSEDPNLLCLVLRARWRHFSMLLTGDAEAESVPIDPGPVDVLKVAHHGSEDAGLDELLEHSVPKLAVISVGAGNPFGHPTAPTIADLGEHGVPIMRTDTQGEIDIEADGSHWTAVKGAG